MAKRQGVSRHTEVEQKFDVSDDEVCPSFDGLSMVSHVDRLPSQSLDAVYFDTPGHDLAANRVTLRRRTGGRDPGWHLKLPAGGHTRTEIHVPLGSAFDDHIPEDLVDVVRAIVRDRPLRPVAHIATRRTVTVLRDGEGATLAEFCDDRVTARNLDAADDGGDEQTWREWELELADTGGDDNARLHSRLENRLLDAGAEPARHGSKLARVLNSTAPKRPEPPDDPVHHAVAAQIGMLLEWDRAVRTDADDSVHQMRVTTRQIRSLLQVCEPEFGLTDDAWILNELRELAAVLGTARDAEVLAARYSEALDSLSAELVRGHVRERLVGGAWRRYHAGVSRSLKAMRSPRYFRLLDALDAVVLARPPAGGPPGAGIASSYRRLRKAAKAARQTAGGREHDEALHRIRKAAKRLRYVAAATGDDKVSERAKTIQSLLGDFQDSVVSRAHLLEQARAAQAAGEDTFTYGVLFARECELASRSEKKLDAAMRALRRSIRDRA